ncbi:hypothetical protein ACB098_11G059400 [Castanea mollissima]
MKNVAKCDTWCELQNPANHRVFERKLCLKPFGRGHVCLGVTHRCPPQLRFGAGAEVGLPYARARAVSLKASPRRRAPRQSVVRRDYPLSLSISISGGKETYKHSPSNVERTGNSPA